MPRDDLFLTPTAPLRPIQRLNALEQLVVWSLRRSREPCGSVRVKAAFVNVFPAANRNTALEHFLRLAEQADRGATPEETRRAPGMATPREELVLMALRARQQQRGMAFAAALERLGGGLALESAALTFADLLSHANQKLPNPAKIKQRANDNVRAEIASARLSPAERLLLQGVRFCVMAMLGHRKDYEPLRDSYGDRGVGPAAYDLEAGMRICGLSAIREIEINCFSCETVSADEQILLEVIGALQMDRRMPAFIGLSGFLPPAGARQIIAPLTRTAEVFADQGLALRDNLLEPTVAGEPSRMVH